MIVSGAVDGALSFVITAVMCSLLELSTAQALQAAPSLKKLGPAFTPYGAPSLLALETLSLKEIASL